MTLIELKNRHDYVIDDNVFRHKNISLCNSVLSRTEPEKLDFIYKFNQWLFACYGFFNLIK